MKKIVLIILVSLSTINSLFAQFFNNNTSSNQIDISFYRNRIESAANKSIFNILIIKNNADTKFKGKLMYTQPTDWKIIGKNELEVDIPANDSIKLPIRVIVSNNVVGEVGYAIIANLYDKDVKPLSSKYCFVTIPRVSKLNIKAPRRMVYFDNKTETARFKYFVSNKGNTGENVQIQVKSEKNLSIESESLDKTFAYEFNIPAHKDTAIDVRIKLDEEMPNRDSYKVDVSVFTQDSLYKNNIWLIKVDDIYNHIIPENNKCAIVELTTSDLLSDDKPRYSLMAKGTVLFKNNLDLYYYLHKNNLSNSWEDYYDQRFYIGLKNNMFDVQAGTVESLFNEYIYGLGVQAELYNIGNRGLRFKGFYSQNNQSTQTAYGGEISYNLLKHVRTSIGYLQNDISNFQTFSKILLTGLRLSFLKKNSLDIKSFISQTNYSFDSTFTKNGVGIISIYSGNFNRLRASARLEYGSPDYTGISQGKLIANTNIGYNLENNQYLNFLYSKQDNINKLTNNKLGEDKAKTTYDAFQLMYNKKLTKHISIYVGPVLRFEKFNFPYIDTIPNLYFKTYSPRAELSLKYNNHNSKLYIRPTFNVGQVSVQNAMNIENAKNTNYMTYSLYLNALYKSARLYFIYRNGPNGIYNQYYYYTSNYFTKWLFLMPSYNRYFFNDRLNLDLRATYRLDIQNKSNGLNFTTNLTMLLAPTWTLRTLASLSSNTRYDKQNNRASKYTSAYLEVAIRKEFNCKQPRFQYHDLKIKFFKDLNGNRQKEDNEPGIKNVLAEIEPDYELEAKNAVTNKDFASTKLLTGPDGIVTYNNIVNGHYKIKYILIGDEIGNFNRAEQYYPFSIDKDKVINIPYLENNRIVGKVILNRSPISSLGKLDVSNIRIIAEDTQGHTYSALTNKKGEFIIYAPITDHYVVRINNIFSENFDLQQPEFIVKFNGYKQFEVSFVFNEKRRKIVFNTMEDKPEKENEEEQFNIDVQEIRKTTLSGKIQEMGSLKPVAANIRIINKTTNKEVSKTVSSKSTGSYSISYVASQNYVIEVRAEGYEHYSENLYIEQVISIQNIEKNIMLVKKK